MKDVLKGLSARRREVPFKHHVTFLRIFGLRTCRFSQCAYSSNILMCSYVSFNNLILIDVIKELVHIEGIFFGICIFQ